MRTAMRCACGTDIVETRNIAEMQIDETRNKAGKQTDERKDRAEICCRYMVRGA